MPLSPTLEAEFDKPSFIAFCAVEIGLPDGPLRLLDGAGETEIFGHTFRGEDDTYGVLSAGEGFSDGVESEAPSLKLELLPPSNTATAVLADPAAQGSPVYIWIGAIDPITGLPVDDPELVFLGQVDVPTVLIRQNTRALQLDVVSSFEQFFAQDEGVRLNGPWHQSIWPGELGLSFAVGVQQQLPWGSDAPRPVMVSDKGSTGGPTADDAVKAALRRFFG